MQENFAIYVDPEQQIWYKKQLLTTEEVEAAKKLLFGGDEVPVPKKRKLNPVEEK